MAAALVAAAVALFWLVARPHPGRLASAQTATPHYDLQPMANTTYSNQSVGAFACLALAHGTLSVHVEHLQQGQRFVVKLPDGQLEVRGTRFTVTAEQGLTERVAVTEGVVELTLAGRDARRLVAGQYWSRAEEPPATGAKPVANAAPPSTALEPSAPIAPSAAHRHDARPRLAAAPRHIDASKRDIHDEVPFERAAAPMEGFAAAMHAFSAGTYLEADDRFAEFIGHFPNDSRCEDAMFLRAVVAMRRGDRAAALRRANEYLQRFPGGLRKNEMAHLVGTSELADAVNEAR